MLLFLVKRVFLFIYTLYIYYIYLSSVNLRILKYSRYMFPAASLLGFALPPFSLTTFLLCVSKSSRICPARFKICVNSFCTGFLPSAEPPWSAWMRVCYARVPAIGCRRLREKQKTLSILLDSVPCEFCGVSLPRKQLVGLDAKVKLYFVPAFSTY